MLCGTRLEALRGLPWRLSEEAAYNAGDPIQSQGWEDPLKKEMATHSSTPAWKIPWMEEPHRLQSMGSQRVGDDGATELN